MTKPNKEDDEVVLYTAAVYVIDEDAGVPDGPAA
jgi:hypothetical protein